MEKNKKILIVMSLAVLFTIPAFVIFGPSDEGYSREITYYGDVILTQINPPKTLSTGQTIDASAGATLRVELLFDVFTRPTIVTTKLYRVGGNVIEIGSLFKQDNVWRWDFTLSTVADGINAYYVSFSGEQNEYVLWYNTFEFNIKGDEPTYDPPEITNTPDDITINEGDTSELIWKFISVADGFYTITEGSTVLADGNIIGSLDEQTVGFSPEELDVGTHSLVFTVRASDNQRDTDTVEVTVNEPPSTTTTTIDTTTTDTTTTDTTTIDTTTTDDDEDEPESLDFTIPIIASVSAMLILVIYLWRRR